MAPAGKAGRISVRGVRIMNWLVLFPGRGAIEDSGGGGAPTDGIGQRPHRTPASGPSSLRRYTARMRRKVSRRRAFGQESNGRVSSQWWILAGTLRVKAANIWKLENVEMWKFPNFQISTSPNSQITRWFE